MKPRIYIAPEGTPLGGDGWTEPQEARLESWSQDNAASLGIEPDDLADMMRPMVRDAARPHYVNASTELRDRLNTRLRGENPGTPLHWKGLL